MTKRFWQDIPKPIIALAPMDGYTDSAFRRVCKTVNPSLVVFTEFTSTDGFHFAREAVTERFRFSVDEQPVIAQIFGNNPDNFIEAAEYCEAQGFSGIDINMGCPAKHVVKSEQGIALRENPDQAARIVEAVSSAVSIPVSVKTRLGIRDAESLTSFGKRLESSGANLLTIHGRTYADPYGCPADFAPIYELQRNVSIPVIGNGGIATSADGVEKLGNLAGYMIGQAALGNPWIFGNPPTPTERVLLIQKHVELMIETKGLLRTLRQIRKHLIAYTHGIPGAAKHRARFARVDSLEAINDAIKEFTQTLNTVQ